MTFSAAAFIPGVLCKPPTALIASRKSSLLGRRFGVSGFIGVVMI